MYLVSGKPVQDDDKNRVLSALVMTFMRYEFKTRV